MLKAGSKELKIKRTLKKILRKIGEIIKNGGQGFGIKVIFIYPVQLMLIQRVQDMPMRCI